MSKADYGFRFKTNKLRRCVEHVLTAREHKDFELKPVAEYELYVVRDDSDCVYIISSGWPRDIMSSGKLYAVYAEHCKMVDSLNQTSGKYIQRIMPDNIVGVIGVITLNVGENGYAFEECMLDMYEEFVFAPPREAQSYFDAEFADAERKAQQFDRRQEAGHTTNAPTKTGRRILKTEQST